MSWFANLFTYGLVSSLNIHVPARFQQIYWYSLPEISFSFLPQFQTCKNCRFLKSNKNWVFFLTHILSFVITKQSDRRNMRSIYATHQSHSPKHRDNTGTVPSPGNPQPHQSSVPTHPDRPQSPTRPRPQWGAHVPRLSLSLMHMINLTQRQKYRTVERKPNIKSPQNTSFQLHSKESYSKKQNRRNKSKWNIFWQSTNRNKKTTTNANKKTVWK